MASHGVIAIGLAVMALFQGVITLLLAWLIVGLGMAMGLYDAVFATLGETPGA